MALGSREQWEVAVTDGTARGEVPIQAVVGRSHHPCLALVGGVHGDEYDGILAVHEVARAVQPDDLQGSLLLIAVANPFAFAAAQRHTPQDGLDLNRTFPGRPDGSLSERLAHALCGVLSQADLALTLHGGGARTELAPWIEFLDLPTPLGRATYEAAAASGFPDLLALPPLPGRLITAMADLGVPVIEGEVGDRGETRRADVAYYRARFDAVARHAGVLPAQAEPPGPSPRLWSLCPVEATADGIFLRRVELLQEVEQGTPLGEIVDLRGEVATRIVAPAPGVVGAYRAHAGVRAGESVMTLWSPARTQVYDEGERPV
jgi:predicted deacylase